MLKKIIRRSFLLLLIVLAALLPFTPTQADDDPPPPPGIMADQAPNSESSQPIEVSTQQLQKLLQAPNK